MEFNYELFCKRIKYLRELKKYSKYQLSIQANIHYQYYCNIENGNKIPNFKSVILIANALNTNLSALLLQNNLNENKIIINNILSMLQQVNDKSLQRKYYEMIILLKMKESKHERI